MKIKYTTFSEAGVRRANQDVCRVVEISDCDMILMVVCDGMGGHSMGDVAAETVCNAVCDYWETHTDCNDSALKAIEACRQASDALYKRSRVVRPIEMGTTLVMAGMEGDKITIAHCGTAVVTCCAMAELCIRHKTIQIPILVQRLYQSVSFQWHRKLQYQM